MADTIKLETTDSGTTAVTMPDKRTFRVKNAVLRDCDDLVRRLVLMTRTLITVSEPKTADGGFVFKVKRDVLGSDLLAQVIAAVEAVDGKPRADELRKLCPKAKVA